MSTVAGTTPETVGELIERLGDVPPKRIRLVPPPGTATEADVLDLADHRDSLCELVDGTLVEKAVGLEESRPALRLAYVVMRFLEESGLGGEVAGADAMHRLLPKTVRMPDVSYCTAERIAAHARGPIGDYAPDLAVEVLSASNTPCEMARKLDEYFASGVRLVWYVDLPSRTVRVFIAPDVVTELGPDDSLDGGNVLPGFSLSIRELFESE